MVLYVEQHASSPVYAPLVVVFHIVAIKRPPCRDIVCSQLPLPKRLHAARSRPQLND